MFFTYNKRSSQTVDNKQVNKDPVRHPPKLIIAATTIEIFFVMKAANAKPPKASLDPMNIVKPADKKSELLTE